MVLGAIRSHAQGEKRKRKKSGKGGCPLVASLVIEQTVPLLAVSLSPRAGSGNNGQPPLSLHENRPTPRDGLHLRDCVAAVPFFRGYFNNPLSQSFEGCRPFFSPSGRARNEAPPGAFLFSSHHCRVQPFLAPLVRVKREGRGNHLERETP